jgi:hypothetical protein
MRASILLLFALLSVAACEASDSLKENVDYQNGYLSGVTYSGLPKSEAKQRCEAETIQRYAMVADDPQGKVDAARFEKGCHDGASGD